MKLQPMGRTRRIQDQTQTVSVTLSNSATKTVSPEIDMNQAGGMEGVLLNVSLPGTTLASGKKLILSMETSADKATWSPVASWSHTITGEATNKTLEEVISYSYPLDALRYIRLATVSEATSGIAAGATAEFYPTF